MGDNRLERREFLRLAAAGAVCAAAGSACSSNSGSNGKGPARASDTPRARGEMTAEEAVKAAEAQIKPIYDKWRERGKI